METKIESNTDLSVLIIGGKGKMGALFAEQLRAKGCDVSVLDRPDPISKDAVNAVDVVILSVPLDKLRAVAVEVLPLVKKGSLLCDFGSLKSEVCSIYGHRLDIETVGLHPMFGPHVSTFEKQRILFCPVNAGEKFAALRTILDKIGFTLREMSSEEHDRMMAYIQVAVHFSKVLLGKVFAESGIEFRDTLASASPIYEMELVMLSRLFSQDPYLYEAIQIKNDFAPAVRQLIAVAAATLNDDLSSGDPRSFREAFESASAYFSDFARESLERTS